MKSFWGLALALIIAAGLASRSVHTGLAIFDKYLGDALYAAMIHVMLRLARPTALPQTLAFASMVFMTVLEFFQLTMIPARMLANDNAAVRIVARLLGTEFHVLDLVAYAVGIGCVFLADSLRARTMPN